LRLTKKPFRIDVAAGIVAGLVGLAWIGLIWTNLVFPPALQLGGGAILTGANVQLSEHEWGFNQFAKGGPPICAVNGTVTITLKNTGINFHGFQIISTAGAFLGGLNKTDLLTPGEVRQVKINLQQLGDFYYICPVSGHRQKGMIAPFLCHASC